MTPASTRRKSGDHTATLIVFALLLTVVGAGWWLRPQSPAAPDAKGPPNGAPVPPSASGSESPAPESLPEATPFDLDHWIQTHAREVDIRAWMNKNPAPYNSWFPHSDVKGAGRWWIRFGPLGIQTRMHDGYWSKFSAFEKLFPPCLVDDAGLIANAFEVLDVQPGSPADGHLLAGDFLIEMDGTPFQTAMLVNPSQPLADGRGLEMHAGMLLDQAEGRGRVAFKVLRFPPWETVHESAELNRDHNQQDLVVDVQGHERIRLVIEHVADNNAWCWANWIRPRLEGPGGTLDLTGEEWVSATTGWGEVKVGSNVGDKPILLDGQVVTQGIGVHARSVIEFLVPEGYQTFRAVVQRGNADRAEAIRARIDAKPRVRIDRPSRTWQNVASRRFMTKAERSAPLELQVPVAGMQRLRLAGSDGGNGNGSDHLYFDQVRLVGPDGEVVPLHALTPVVSQNGYRGVETDRDTGVWHVHAPCRFEYLLPEGAWTLRGRVRPGNSATIDVDVELVSAPHLSPSLAHYMKEVEFPIPRIGSYAKGSPSECEKTRRVAAMTAAWVACQQRADGSWPRFGGYTDETFDTSVAGLALLATGDPAYDEPIRKAAHFFLREGRHAGWTVPTAMPLIFLSEYYLRAQDPEVLLAIQLYLDRVASVVIGDYTAGHGRNPGYAGGGMSIGGSHCALALALASKTPIAVDRTLLDNMLVRLQQMAPDGYVPYGRGRGRTPFEPGKAGHSYSARSGPYFLASLIYGGPRLYTESARGLYANNPPGNADQGHSSASLSMIWAGLAAACCGDEVHRNYMEAYHWKTTMMRAWDGGFIVNPIMAEYMGAERLIGPYYRAATFLLAFHAGEHNLAVSGKSEWMAHTFAEVPPVQHVDAMTWDRLQRDWSVMDAALGAHSPTSLQSALKRLRGLEPGEDLADQVQDILRNRGPGVARAMAKIEGFDQQAKGYLLEMALGLDHRIFVSRKEDAGKGELQGGGKLQSENAQSGALNRRSRRTSGPTALYTVELDTVLTEPFPLSGTVTFLDPKGLLMSEPVALELDANRLKQSVELKLPAEGPLRLVAQFNTRVGDTPIRYQRPLRINMDEELGAEARRSMINCRQFWVRGRLIRDYLAWDASFVVANGHRIAASGNGRRILVEDGDQTYNAPDERPLTAGTVCSFLYSTGTRDTEAIVSRARVLRHGVPIVQPRRMRFTGATQSGPVASLAAYNEDTACSLELSDAGAECTVELVFPEPHMFTAFEFASGRQRAPMIAVDAFVEGSWKPTYRGVPGGMLLHTTVPARTDRLRMTLQPRDATRQTLTLTALRWRGTRPSTPAAPRAM